MKNEILNIIDKVLVHLFSIKIVIYIDAQMLQQNIVDCCTVQKMNIERVVAKRTARGDSLQLLTRYW